MAKEEKKSNEEWELLDTPDPEEEIVKPPMEGEEERRSERGRPWREDEQEEAREAYKETVMGQPDVPPEAVGREDLGTPEEATIADDVEVPEDVVGRLDRGETEEETVEERPDVPSEVEGRMDRGKKGES